MRILRRPILLYVVFLCVLLASCPTQASADRIYYGIEISGVLCGYSEIDTSTVIEDGKELLGLKQNTSLMLSALGSEFNTDLKFTYHIDRASGGFVYHDSDITQGPTKFGSLVYVEGDTAHFASTTDGRKTAVPLPPNVILENTVFFPHLKKDFVDLGLDEKTYQIYEVREAEVQETTYTRAGAERVEMAGQRYDAIILDELNKKTGLRLKWWIDAETGQALKALFPNNRISFLTDESVVRKIEMVSLDDRLFSKTNVRIADIQAISYMKVRATVQPSGLWITPESLNVPGQTFAGTVEENLVDGVFEIEHKRYDGSGAPPFPPDFSSDESLKEYLQPDMFVESDDEVLIEKAKELTEGSKDSWEAAYRLSQWVAENIHYAIPGGTTARKTYDTRSGECGAHSMLLASFCRAVGIPARVVWGCMYVPNSGGSFGQHGWSEIYMGKAGWIPVDATALETDYVDSGHIRIGVYQSPATALNPGEMEVLDYRIGPGTGDDSGEVNSARYDPYVGDYTNKDTGRTVKISVQDGSLTMDIQDQMILPFSDPDDEGKWCCKLAPHLFCTFEEDEAGRVSEVHLHEMITLPKQSGPDTTGSVTPEELRPYVGKYLLPQLNAEFAVVHREGGLSIEDPLAKATIGLQPPDEDGRWVDEFNKNVIRFEFDEEGEVTSLVVESISRFSR